jgi:hypothetical protein
MVGRVPERRRANFPGVKQGTKPACFHKRGCVIFKTFFIPAHKVPYVIVPLPPYSLYLFTYPILGHETPAEEILGFVSDQDKEVQMEMHRFS